MSAVTSQQLIDAAQDVLTLAAVVNGPEATVQARSGGLIKSLLKLQSEAEAFIESFAYFQDYTTRAAGVAATTVGDLFTSSEGGTPTLYRHISTAPNYEAILQVPSLLSLTANTGAAMIGTIADAMGAYGRKLQDKADDTVSVKDFGAIADGNYHPLSERYGSLAAAQAVYPFVTALTESIDWAAMQAAANHLETLGGGTVRMPVGRYIPNKSTQIPNNVVFEGESRTGTIIDNQNLVLAAPQFVNKNTTAFREAGLRNMTCNGGTHALKGTVSGEGSQIDKLVLEMLNCNLQSNANIELSSLMISVLRSLDLNNGTYGLRVTGAPINGNVALDLRLTNHEIDLALEAAGEGWLHVGGSFEDNEVTGSQTGVCIYLANGFRGFTADQVFFESTHETLLFTRNTQQMTFRTCIFSGHKIPSGIEAWEDPWDTDIDLIGFEPSNWLRYTLPAPPRLRGGHAMLTDHKRTYRDTLDYEWRVFTMPADAAAYTATSGAFDLLDFVRTYTGTDNDNLQDVAGRLRLFLHGHDAAGNVRHLDVEWHVSVLADKGNAIFIRADRDVTHDFDDGAASTPNVTLTVQQKAGATNGSATLEVVVAGLNTGLPAYLRARFAGESDTCRAGAYLTAAIG